MTDEVKIHRAFYRLDLLEKMEALIDKAPNVWDTFINRKALKEAIQENYKLMLGDSLIDP